MTQAAIGGPAQTTYRVTSRQGVIGRDAQRVFVVSDGRPAEGGPQQAVYYVSDAEIAAGDFVISGNKPIPIVEVGPVGVEYPPIAVYVVTANSASDFPPQPDPAPPPPIGPVLLLDLQADTLSLADGDPVSTWADQSGNGRNFTQTGTARPTYHTGAYPYIEFDGIDDWLLGPVFADNLDSFTVFMVINRKSNAPFLYSPVICKLADVNLDTGWSIEQQGRSFFCSIGGFTDFTSAFSNYNTFPNTFEVITDEMTDRVSMTIYINGSGVDSSLTVVGTLSNYGNSEPVRIGMEGDNGVADGFLKSKLQAIRIYAPAPDATQRAAIESELAARYGITL